jgi:hypothetical protein
MSTSICDSNICCFYNLASFLFKEHKYKEALMILDLLLDHLNENEGNLIIKVCFLSLDAIIRLVHKHGSFFCEEEIKMFHHKSQKLIETIEYYNSRKDAFNIYFEKFSSEYNKNFPPIIKKDNLIRSIVTFRLHLYNCRRYIELSNLKNSKKEIKHCLEIYQKEIKQFSEINEESLSPMEEILGNIYFGCPLSPFEYQNRLALHMKVYFY